MGSTAGNIGPLEAQSDSGTGVPVSVAVSASRNAFESGAPERLPIQGAIWPSWGVSGDGKRILLALAPQANVETPITVLLNWASAIER